MTLFDRVVHDEISAYVSSTTPTYVDAQRDANITWTNVWSNPNHWATGAPDRGEWTCIVCRMPFPMKDEENAQEDFCPLCHAALLQLRKNYLADSLEKIGIAKEREDSVSFHQGFTKTGSLVHAVGLVRRGEYQARAACGVRISEAKARKFEQVEKGSECKRCQESLSA